MTVYLDKEGVLVDDSKLVIHGTTYPLRNISSYEDIFRMKEVWDFKRAVVVSLMLAATITVITLLVGWWFFDNFDAVGTLVVVFVAAAIFCIVVDYREKVTTEPVFDFTALSVTVAGSTKHALIVKDKDNGLVYDVKIALDEAIAQL